jgi:hypothetical protein|tara:strand:+ start:2203 stop:2631 length:429 start_codon:yes stop_codon:yes gene_type:complete
MNIINKKILIIFTLAIFFQFLNVSLKAADVDEIDKEELPAQDPFQGGAIETTTDQMVETNTQDSGKNIMNNMRLVGTVFGQHTKVAVLAMPDGRIFKFEENEFIAENIHLLDIYTDLIVVKINQSEEFEVYMNNQIRPREGN